jgi:hypothetical protein
MGGRKRRRWRVWCVDERIMDEDGCARDENLCEGLGVGYGWSLVHAGL